LGYEYVPDDTPVFESHPFIQAGFGARYPLTDRVTLVSEFRALQMFGSSNEDNEFALMLGIDVPLFVEVIRAPVEKGNRSIPTPQAPQVKQYQEPVVIDNDNDGVIDTVDKCLHTPAGSAVDVHGCTIVNAIVIPQEVTYEEDVATQQKIKSTIPVMKKPAPVKIKRQNLKIGFESNSAVIKDASRARVKRFANYLKNNPNSIVTIEGYTDSSGQRAKNIALSTKRAQAVRALLIKYGANASKIKAVGKGDLNPIADNDTESGRMKNRRIEAVIH
jgi:OOP family OmpA-OmpF porin